MNIELTDREAALLCFALQRFVADAREVASAGFLADARDGEALLKKVREMRLAK